MFFVSRGAGVSCALGRGEEKQLGREREERKGGKQS